MSTPWLLRRYSLRGLGFSLTSAAGRLSLLAGAVHALSIWTVTARRVNTADAADVLYQATCATAASAYLTGDAAFVAEEAGAIGRAARVARSAHLTFCATNTLPDAQALGPTADATTRQADRPALTHAVDLAATAIFDNPVAYPAAELATGFWTALLILVPPPPVMIVFWVPGTAATADDGAVATTSASRDRSVGN